MTEHVHDWIPIQGKMAKYSCATCGALGYRSRRTGKMMESMRRQPLSIEHTARPASRKNVNKKTHGQWNERKP